MNKLLLVLALVIQATIISTAAVSDGGVYYIRPKGQPGQVLGIAGASTAVGANLIAEPQQNTNFERFRLHQANAADTYYIEIIGSGLYVSNFVSPPRQAGFNPDAFYQEYQLIPAPGGYYMIRPVDNANGVMTLGADGTSLSWQPRTGADNQLFFFCSSSVIPSNGTVGRAALKAARLFSENPEGIDLRS